MLDVVIQTLSTDRFDTYLKAAGHDKERALRLYIWNAQIGEAFHTPIQAVEVALRNAVNHALVAQFGPDWWKERPFTNLLDVERRADINVVTTRINRRGIPLVTAQIVAGLSFGFWVGLLQPRFNPAVWSTQLRTVFPHLPETETRASLVDYAAAVAGLRNRISHHEPIFKRDLSKDFGDLMKLLEWICPPTQQWIRPHCRIPTLMRAKP